MDKSCSHKNKKFLGTRVHFGDPCPVTGTVEGRFKVYHCKGCHRRIEVNEADRSVNRYKREDLSTREPSAEPANDPTVYVPTHDGVDAVADTREASNGGHFDARGGAAGIGDRGVYGGASC